MPWGWERGEGSLLLEAPPEFLPTVTSPGPRAATATATFQWRQERSDCPLARLPSADTALVPSRKDIICFGGFCQTRFLLSFKRKSRQTLGTWAGNPPPSRSQCRGSAGPRTQTRHLAHGPRLSSRETRRCRQSRFEVQGGRLPFLRKMFDGHWLTQLYYEVLSLCPCRGCRKRQRKLHLEHTTRRAPSTCLFRRRPVFSGPDRRAPAGHPVPQHRQPWGPRAGLVGGGRKSLNCHHSHPL